MTTAAPNTDGGTLVGMAKQEVSDAGDNLGAAFLIHPNWTQVSHFRDRAYALRDDIAAWLQGNPT